MRTHLIILFVAVLSCFSCKSNQKAIEEEFVMKCINAHGGMASWKSLNTTDYLKNVTLFDKNGNIEKEISQSHAYSKNPELTGTIEWNDSINRKITFEQGKSFKTNGGQQEEPSQSALSTFNSAYYVLNMPWKLLDNSADITYLGIDTILNDKIVHTLKVEYPSEGQADEWEYYLDIKDYHLLANMVKHESIYSLIINDDYVWYKGLKFNAKRTSYITDSLGQVLFQRAKYEYVFSKL